jgi:MFS family permease
VSAPAPLEGAASAERAQAAPDSAAYLGWVLGILFLIQVFSIADRMVLGVLAEEIKREFGVSDSWLGLLMGPAFALFYCTIGLPVARLADRVARRGVAAVAVALWSAATAACGMAQNFAQLALARFAVGVGEAGGSAPSHALISDYFPPERRARALGIISAGGSAGVFVGHFAGHLNTWFGWRATFWIIGAAGVLLALLVRLTIREPRRGRFDAPGITRERESFGRVLRFFLPLRSYWHLSLAAAIHSFAGYGASMWTPVFLIRVHGLDTSDIANTLAPISLIASGTGIVASGFVVQWLSRRDVRWYMWLPALASLVALPFSYGVLLAPELWMVFAFMLLPSFLGAVYAAPTWAMVQGLAKPAMRAFASAMTLLLINLIGFGLGPQVVGILNDALEQRFGAEAVRYSLMIIGVFHVWAALHNYLAARTLAQDLKAKEA